MFCSLFPHEVSTISRFMERSCESTGREALPQQRATIEGLMDSQQKLWKSEDYEITFLNC